MGIQEKDGSRRGAEARRARLVADRLDQRQAAIFAAVPPSKPPAQYWLMSDCGASYCEACCLKERAKEFGFNMIPLDDWRMSDCDVEADDCFYDGIDSVGEYHCTSSPEWCRECGQMLAYFLDSDLAVSEEMAYYFQNPLSVLTPDDSYQLHQLFINISWASERWQIVGMARIIKQAELVLRAFAASRETTLPPAQPTKDI